MATLKKNGRVFYGGSSGHVNELKFQDLTNSIFGVVSVDPRQLVKVNLQAENFVVKLVPSFFKSAPS
jgi:hypothetical protein